MINIAILCPDIPDPANGQILFSGNMIAPFELRTVATYSCDPGYGLMAMMDTTERTCEDLDSDIVGEWSATPPSCEGEC